MASRSARKSDESAIDFQLDVKNTWGERIVVRVEESISIAENFELSSDDTSTRRTDHTTGNRIFQIQSNEQIHVARHSETTD